MSPRPATDPCRGKQIKRLMGSWLTVLRMLIRRRESWLVLLGGLLGAIAGLVVVLLHHGAYLIQRLLFQLPAGQRLSLQDSVSWVHVMVPAIGGILLWIVLLLLRKRKARYIDLVEGNALHDG